MSTSVNVLFDNCSYLYIPFFVLQMLVTCEIRSFFVDQSEHLSLSQRHPDLNKSVPDTRSLAQRCPGPALNMA